MPAEMVQERLLKGGELEEITLFGDAFDDAAADRTMPLDELCFRNEHLIDRAVPAFVLSLVDVAAIAHAPPQGLRGRLVTRFGGANEVVVRDIQHRPDV